MLLDIPFPPRVTEDTLQAYLQTCANRGVEEVVLDSEGPSKAFVRPTNIKRPIPSPSRTQAATLIDVIAGAGATERVRAIYNVREVASTINGLWSGIRYNITPSGSDGWKVTFRTRSRNKTPISLS